MHGEITSEKMAIGYLFDGKLQWLLAHIPMFLLQTIDDGQRTAYQTDLGMCGDYNSVNWYE